MIAIATIIDQDDLETRITLYAERRGKSAWCIVSADGGDLGGGVWRSYEEAEREAEFIWRDQDFDYYAI